MLQEPRHTFHTISCKTQQPTFIAGVDVIKRYIITTMLASFSKTTSMVPTSFLALKGMVENPLIPKTLRH